MDTRVVDVDDSKGILVRTETTIYDYDQVGVLGTGSHTRAVVSMDKINKRLSQRRDKLEGRDT